MGELIPFARNSDTSRAAAKSMEGVAPSLRDLVLKLIKQHRMTGITCDEIEIQLGLVHQTASARIRELVLDDSIVDKGIRRNTRSGRKAVAWVAR